MFKIKKAKLIEGKRPEYAFTRDTSKRQFVGTEMGKDDAHPDLIAAFHALTAHWCLLAGQISFDDVDDIDNVDEKLLEPFKCYAFSIGGNEKKQGITLSGQYTLPNKKVMSWSAPFELFGAADDKRYIYMDELLAKLDLLDKELIQYIEGTKVAPNPQQEMNFGEGEEPVTSAQIATPENPVFKSTGIPQADPEAQARVAGMEAGQDLKETPEGKVKKTRTSKKKVPQSADHPGGEVEQTEEA